MQRFILLLSLTLSLLAGFSAMGQDKKQEEIIRAKIKDIVEEKMKFDPAGIESGKIRIGNNGVLQKPIFFSRAGDSRISTSEIPESEVHAAINPLDSNNIVACPIYYKSIVGGYELALPIFYTKDFGNTWKQSAYLPRAIDTTVTIWGGGDPVFTFDPDGNLYLTWINLYYKGSSSPWYWGMLWAMSTDGGETWQAPDSNFIALSSAKNSTQLPAEIYDKQWMASDHSNSSFRGNIYVTYLKASTVTMNQNIVLRRKRPGVNYFDSFETNVSQNLYSDLQFTSIGVDSNGYVHITFYVNKSMFVHTVSTDGGISFSTPNFISSIHMPSAITGIKSNPQSRLYPCPHLVIDNSISSPYRGYMYFVWSGDGINSSESDRSDIYFTRSVDNGNTWEMPVVIFDSTSGKEKDQFYPSISVNPDGVVAITWYDARFSVSASNNDLVKYFMAYSFDGGQTFTRNFPVSTQFTDFQTVGLKNNQFGIGEYNQVLTTRGYAIPIWSDGRLGNGNLDIFAAIVPLNRNPSGISELRTINDQLVITEMLPNPTRDFINLGISLSRETDIEIDIVSLNGQAFNLFRGRMKQGNHPLTLKLPLLTDGTYLISISSSNAIVTKKLTILQP